jgi:hypothetical protein
MISAVRRPVRGLPDFFVQSCGLAFRGVFFRDEIGLC